MFNMGMVKPGRSKPRERNRLRPNRREGAGTFSLEYDEFGMATKHLDRKLLWNITSIHQFSNTIYQDNGNICWQLLSRDVT